MCRISIDLCHSALAHCTGILIIATFYIEVEPFVDYSHYHEMQIQCKIVIDLKVPIG